MVRSFLVLQNKRMLLQTKVPKVMVRSFIVLQNSRTLLQTKTSTVMVRSFRLFTTTTTKSLLQTKKPTVVPDFFLTKRRKQFLSSQNTNSHTFTCLFLNRMVLSGGREHGVKQFVSRYRKVEGISNDELKWGDEVSKNLSLGGEIEDNREMLPLSIFAVPYRPVASLGIQYLPVYISAWNALQRELCWPCSLCLHLLMDSEHPSIRPSGQT